MERPCTRLSRFICDIRLASDTWISNVKNVLRVDKEKDGLHIWSSVMGLKPKVTFTLIWKAKTNCPVSFLSKCLY